MADLMPFVCRSNYVGGPYFPDPAGTPRPHPCQVQSDRAFLGPLAEFGRLRSWTGAPEDSRHGHWVRLGSQGSKNFCEKRSELHVSSTHQLRDPVESAGFAQSLWSIVR